MSNKESLTFQKHLDPSIIDPFVPEEADDASFNTFLPYSDLNVWVPEDSIHDEIRKAFPMYRLSRVRALSFLSYPGPSAGEMYFLEYHHDRLDHSSVVALVTEQILKQNAFSQNDINLGIIAGNLHDIATPALGDATKNVDPENLHEESFWWEVLGKKGKKFLTQHDITRRTLDDIIKNKGIIGKVLDIADRITYTMKDLHANIADSKFPRLNLEPRLLPLRYLLSHSPKLGNIYKDVGVDKKTGKVFFIDPKNLETFLLLRAHLHQSLYLHPTNQGRDLLIAKLIEPMYSKDDPSMLTPSKLREMDDNELLQAIYNYHKPSLASYEFDQGLINWFPQYERFESEEDAQKREKILKRRKNTVVIGIKRCQGFDPATTYNVLDEKGRIVSFRDYAPGEAAQIELIAESVKGVFVYYVDISEDSPTNTLLKAVFNRSST